MPLYITQQNMPKFIWYHLFKTGFKYTVKIWQIVTVNRDSNSYFHQWFYTLDHVLLLLKWMKIRCSFHKVVFLAANVFSV